MLSPDAAQVLIDLYHRDGSLSADAVLEAATPKTSPLHPEFEWSDPVAGHEYRRIQARDLIRREYATVIVEENKVRYRTWLHTDAGYAPTAEVLSSKASSKLILERMRLEAESFLRRYEKYEQLAGTRTLLNALRRWLQRTEKKAA